MTDRISSYFKAFLPYILIGAMIMYIISDALKKPDIQIVKSQSDTVIDTFYMYDTIYPDTIFINLPTQTIIDTFWKTKYIDTSSVLSDYFNTNIGYDTIINSESLFVSFTWFTNMNKLTKVTPFVINRKETLINTVTKTIEPKRLSLGANIIINESHFDVIPSIMYRHNKVVFSYGYGFRKTHQIGVYYTF